MFIFHSQQKQQHPHPTILENRIAELSTHPSAVQISKYSAVNIRSIVILVANRT
jgi:hypothetical protein